MRAYLPVTWADLATLSAGPLAPARRTAFVVDPEWRRSSPDVSEEEWEYEAQALAADTAARSGGGVLLAVDLDTTPAPVDGCVEVDDGVMRSQVRAVLTEDLSWFGAQEIEQLLDQR